jgi:dUTP pyrophosphatase
MEVKIKKLHPLAVIPTYATEDSAGMDLTVVSWEFDEYGNKVYHTGLAFEIPKGYAGFIFPRSSNAKKHLWLTNSVGIIDADYRGEVTLKFKASVRMMSSFWSRIKIFMKKPLNGKDDCNITNLWDGNDYQIGDKCGQIVIMPFPKIEFKEVDELSETCRGAGAYGSTGK